jgi:hypothetical protein
MFVAVKTKRFSTFKLLPSFSTLILTHTVHLSSHPNYPARANVSELDWDVADANYSPVEFTHPAVLANDASIKKNGWADPNEWTPELAAMGMFSDIKICVYL